VLEEEIWSAVCRRLPACIGYSSLLQQLMSVAFLAEIFVRYKR